MQTPVKRCWNLSLWAGFLLVVAGVFSYIHIFELFPITRDFPWANLLLFLAGGVLLGRGLTRAFRQPELYRGKILGSILIALSVAAVSLFVFGVFYEFRQVPASAAAPRVGQKAPDFTLPDQDGKPLALAELLASPPSGAGNARASGVLLIFYRGYW